jgi:hypothetical protein
MSIYSESLHATVVNSLQNQYLDQKDLSSQMNAAGFTLYYAQGATITTEEKLEKARADAAIKETVNKQTVINNNIANNLLSPANQANQYANQSISNTAVCASNVQVAANAIIRLATDIGTIRSIIAAADFSTDMQKQTKNVYDLMNDTAYSAEKASQLAMEASTLTTEVSSSTVVDKAKNINEQLNNLLKTTSAELDTALQSVTAGNAMFSKASNTENLAGGALATINVAYNASGAAYNSFNKTLNLDLRVPDTGITDSSFVVQFTKVNYPVSEYYVVIVKDIKKSTFSLANAENLLLQKETLILISVPMPHVSHTNHSPLLSRQINFFDMPGTNKILQDSDGDDVVQAQRYVAFAFAVLTDAYKTEINNFDNFLSAPSEPFILTIKLKAVDSGTITFKSDNNLQKLEFTIEGNTAYNPEYRCIFLPADAQGLIFNVTIAEQVSRGNYSIAKKQDLKNLYEVCISPETTDNFGNPLVPGKAYLPVILTVSSDEVDTPSKFTNALSAIDKKAAFYYNQK